MTFRCDKVTQQSVTFGSNQSKCMWTWGSVLTHWFHDLFCAFDWVFEFEIFDERDEKKNCVYVTCVQTSTRWSVENSQDCNEGDVVLQLNNSWSAQTGILSTSSLYVKLLSSLACCAASTQELSHHDKARSAVVVTTIMTEQTAAHLCIVWSTSSSFIKPVKSSNQRIPCTSIHGCQFCLPFLARWTTLNS